MVDAWSGAEAASGPEIRKSCGRAEKLPARGWRPVLAPVLRFLVHLFARVESQGVDQMPQRGPLILMLNHIHLLDPVILVAVVPRYAVAMGKEEIMGWPIVGPLVHRYPTISVRRGDLDIDAIRQSVAVLNGDLALIIAPEGTRSPTRSLLPAKKGLVFLAQQCDPLLQPVAVTGTTEFPGCLKRLRRAHVRFRFGRPFRFRWPEGRVSRDVMQQMADEAMYELARLLPPEMRGVYADLGAATTEWLEFEP